MAKVKIIVPNYNKSAFLNDAFEGIVGQTYRDWECQIIDGYSTDASWSIISEFATMDRRVTACQVTRTGRLYDAWNFGLEDVSDCEYAIIHTSDDRWEPDFLSMMVNALDSVPFAHSAFGSTLVHDKSKNKVSVSDETRIARQLFATKGNAHKPILVNSRDLFVAQVVFGPLMRSAHAVLFRTGDGMYPRFEPEHGSVADYKWYLDLSLAGDVVFVPDALAYWSFYPGQATHWRNSKSIARILTRISDEVCFSHGRSISLQSRTHVLAKTKLTARSKRIVHFAAMLGARYWFRKIPYRQLKKTSARDVLGHIVSMRLFALLVPIDMIFRWFAVDLRYWIAVRLWRLHVRVLHAD